MNNEEGLIELGEYIVAFEHPPKEGNKMPYYELCNKDFTIFKLGTIKWFGKWRKYCWFTDELTDDIVFDSKCLHEIIDFMDKLNRKRTKKDV